MPDATDAKLDGLKTFFEQEMPDHSIERKQTDKGFDERVWSFFFIARSKTVPNWDWCIKISMQFVEHYALARIIKALELNQWKARLKRAARGTFFKLDRGGFQGPLQGVPS
ncbi:MAG TPA: hypothetical protein VEO19_02090 [Terriglobia bacterium]|nr:hypothetical protein [Terriglobia bacterium]